MRPTSTLVCSEKEHRCVFPLITLPGSEKRKDYVFLVQRLLVDVPPRGNEGDRKESRVAQLSILWIDWTPSKGDINLMRWGSGKHEGCFPKSLGYCFQTFRQIEQTITLDKLKGDILIILSFTTLSIFKIIGIVAVKPYFDLHSCSSTRTYCFIDEKAKPNSTVFCKSVVVCTTSKVFLPPPLPLGEVKC